MTTIKTKKTYEKPSMMVYQMNARPQLLQASATVPLDDDEPPVIEQW